MKKPLAVLILACVCTSAFAQEPDAPVVPRETYFAVLGSSLIEPDDRRNPQLDGGTGVDLRYGNRPDDGGWGFEIRLFQESLEKTDGDTGNRGGLGADALYRSPQFAFVTLYGLGGFGLSYSDALPGRDWIAPVVNAGVGVESGALLRLGGRALRLRAEYRYSYEDNRDEYTTPTDYDRANYTESRVFAGLSYAFAAPAPAPTPPVEVVPAPPLEPEPAPVVAPEPAPAPAAPGDADGDGIPDDQDRCANSAAGKTVDAEGCTILKVLTLKGVNFEVDSDQLKPESNAVLDEAVAALNAEFPEARIEVAGHTDSTGDDAYNQDLSRRRAATVLDYLVGQGVKAERLTATGYGETAPVAGNETREGRAQNRRVELRVKSD
jgi:OOP family OmpA-OmpF porin